MTELMVAVKRRRNVSPDAFHEYWRTTHAGLVKSIAASRRDTKKHVHSHTDEQAYQTGEVPCDGVVEPWFESIDNQEAFFSDPDYLAKVRPYESKFADMDNTAFSLPGRSWCWTTVTTDFLRARVGQRYGPGVRMKTCSDA